MNILVTNDDGYDSKGINVLKNVLARNHNVFVFAPERNMSAVSSAININKPLKVYCKEKNVWACSGTPSDCVIAALKGSFIDIKIDLIVSGINAGPNLGTDIIYSGTCAAARQGVLYGVPSIAVSEIKNKENDFDYRNLSEFILENIQWLRSLCFCNVSFKSKADGKNPSCFVNVNCHSQNKSVKAVLTNNVCSRDYNDTVKVLSATLSESGEKYFDVQIDGGILCSKNIEGSDVDAVNKGFVSVSCIQAEPSVIMAL